MLKTESIKGLKEFDLPFEFSTRQAKTALGLLTTFDPKKQIKVWHENYPNLTFEEDEKGNIIVDASAYQEEMGIAPEDVRGVLNMPGVSGRDLLQAGFQVAAFTPAGKTATLAKTIPGKMTAVGTASGVTQAAQDLTGQAMGATDEVSVGNIDGGDVALAAGGGAFAEGLFDVFAKHFPRLTESLRITRNTDVQVDDQMRQAFKAAAIKEGIDPESVTDDVIHDFVKMAKQSVNPKNMAATREVNHAKALTDEFDIPYTQGQSTQNTAQLNLEDSMRFGLTDKSQQVIQHFDDIQARKIDAATKNVQGQLSGGSPQVETANQAAEIAGSAVKSKASTLDQAIQQAYANVGNASLDVDGVRGLMGAMKSSLKSVETITNLKSTSTLLKDISKMEEVLSTPNVAIKPTHIKRVEGFRRRLNALIGAAENPTDKRQLVQAKIAFDRYLDDAVTNSLFSGDDAALESLKHARELRAEYGKLFQQNSTKAKSGAKLTDEAGKVIERIVEANPTNEEITNYLFGTAKLVKNNASAKVAKQLKNILGKDSPEFNSIREAAFMRLAGNELGAKSVSAAKFSKRLNDALYGSGESFMKELFSPGEMAQFKRLADAIKRAQPGIVNPSKTSYKLTQTLRQSINTLASRIGVASGDLATAAALQVTRHGAKAISDRAANKAAKQAVGGVIRPLQNINSTWVGGVTAGTVSAGNQLEEQQ